MGLGFGRGLGLGHLPLRPLVFRCELRMDLGSRHGLGAVVSLVAVRRRLGRLGAAAPGAVWDVGGGLSVSWFDIDEFIPPHWYCFVEERYLTEVNLRERIVQPARNVTLVNVTKNITRYELNGGRVINRSIDVERIEGDTGATIKRYRPLDVNSPAAMRQAMGRGDGIAFYRPSVSRSPLERAPQSPRFNQMRPPNAPSSDLIRQHEEERRQLEQQQKAQSDALREQRHQELARPPAEISSDELSRRHETEQRAFEEQAQRERRWLENWHSMERFGGMPPAGRIPSGGRRH